MIAKLLVVVFFVLLISAFRVGQFFIDHRASDSKIPINTINRARFDEVKAVQGTTYPICSELPQLFKSQADEEARGPHAQIYYPSLMDNGNLHCGKERVGLGVFGKR